jgi:hypothetical protein
MTEEEAGMTEEEAGMTEEEAGMTEKSTGMRKGVLCFTMRSFLNNGTEVGIELAALLLSSSLLGSLRAGAHQS